MWHEVLPVAGGRQALRGADPLTLRFRLCLRWASFSFCTYVPPTGAALSRGDHPLPPPTAPPLLVRRTFPNNPNKPGQCLNEGSSAARPAHIREALQTVQRGGGGASRKRPLAPAIQYLTALWR